MEAGGWGHRAGERVMDQWDVTLVVRRVLECSTHRCARAPRLRPPPLVHPAHLSDAEELGGAGDVDVVEREALALGHLAHRLVVNLCEAGRWVDGWVGGQEQQGDSVR